MKVTALAGGVGAGKFLRGLARIVAPEDLTVVVNTGDDITMHGLHVSPDVDSVLYALSGLGDRERGWGRADETFRATVELRDRFSAPDAWFNLGDLDLAIHLRRTALIAEGASLAEATASVAASVGVGALILPMSDDPVTTRVLVRTADGGEVERHFQEYWVRYGASEPVVSVRSDGAEKARPASGVLEAITEADIIIICPSNPVASIAPILAVPGIRDAVAARRDRVVGISPIIGGAPVRGMADKLMPAAGLEVSALGAAQAYTGLLAGWVVDERDAALVDEIAERLGIRVATTQTLMPDDDDAVSTSLARTTLALLG